MRKKGPDNIVSDVYDCDAWQCRFGIPSIGNNRIVVLYCTDGIPAFKSKGVSLMPGMYIILSLPPHLRYKPQYMLLSVLIPSSLKAASQKKFYDYIVANELNPLAVVGIRPRHRHSYTKVKVFGISLDLPGRDKFLWLRG